LDLSEIAIPSQHMKYDGFGLQGDLDSDVEESENNNLNITETGSPLPTLLQPNVVVATGDAIHGVAESTVESVETDAVLAEENFGEENLLMNSEGQSYLPM
jgi:hypothetical protein